MMTAYPIFYLMNHTDNRLALSSAALCRVDDFTMSITPPKAGIISLTIHIDGCEPSTFVLRAENDDLMKLKTWMEDVVRDEHAEVELSGGQRLAYCVTDVPESSVEPTIRFLDELFPSPIGILTLTPAEGQAVECVVKVKHFLNAMYLYLLTGGNADRMLGDYGEHFSEEWYAYLPTKEPCYERIHKSLYHYNQLQSSLIEWYLCASVSYAAAQPQFQWVRAIPKVLTMWDDWGELFWCEGVGEGSEYGLAVGDYDFDLSDVEGLRKWDDDFHVLEKLSFLYKCDDDAPIILTQQDKEWHIRGYRLAQEVRQRMPLNAALIYELTWDIAYDTPEWQRDIGHVIFNPRLLEKTPL